MTAYNTKLWLAGALAALTMATTAPAAQGAKQKDPFPAGKHLDVDKEVRIGHLPNGLTYYIRHNEKPKGQADFYIAQKVGSILEEENQRGLAHFLEHMCFNGTTNFPDNSLREWLEGIGVKFGANLNAYTAVDQTVYNISNVPVGRTSVQDSCLLILHDWANDLTLDPAEIDKERGVIHEEWRRSMQGQMRILEGILPSLFPTTRYGQRLPIGTMEVVDNFAPQALRDYYETWYRPDQQAIIVVGDIDPARIEAKIKEMFSPIPKAKKAKKRIYQPVPDHKGTLYGIGADPEQKQYVASLMFLKDKFPRDKRDTPGYFRDNYMRGMVAGMINARLAELQRKPDAPFAQASVGFGDYILSKTKGQFELQALAKGTDITAPLQAVYREALRAARTGFTPGEYSRLRDQHLAAYQRAYNNRAATENGSYVGEYVAHFLDNEPIPGIDTEWAIAQKLAAEVTLNDLNALAATLITPDNRALMIMAPEKEGITLPTPADLEAALAAVDAESLEPYTDQVRDEPLIAQAPVPGKIVEETHSDLWDATVWTLSNGAKVWVKPTKFKEDEILFSAKAKGGYDGYSHDYDATLALLPNMLNTHGLGSFNSTDLRKYLAGKVAGVGMAFGPYSRGVSGSSTPADLPTLMELTYKIFTDVTFDPEEVASMKEGVKALMAHRESDPNFTFSKHVAKTLYESPRQQPATAGQVDQASIDQAAAIVKDLTANLADYTFVFTGNIDTDKLRPLVETYLASLPGDASTARLADPELDPAMFSKAGAATDSFTTVMANPMTLVYINEIGEIPYSTRNALLANIAGQILTNRLIKTVREDIGAVYSIGASGSGSRTGINPFSLGTSFPMKPEMKHQVLDFIASQYKAMETGVTPDELNPIKEFMAKGYHQSLEKNAQWMGAIMGNALNGTDSFHEYLPALESITVQDVMDYMKALNAQGNYRVITLDAETAPAQAAE